MEYLPHERHVSGPGIIVKLLVVKLGQWESATLEIVGNIMSGPIKSFISIKNKFISLGGGKAVDVNDYFRDQDTSSGRIQGQRFEPTIS